MAHSRYAASPAALTHSVIDFIFYQNPETLQRLLNHIKYHPNFFFQERSNDRTLFERILVTDGINSLAQLTNAIGFIAQLWMAGLNPLVLCYNIDRHSINMCIRILNAAFHTGLMKAEDYTAFFISALSLIDTSNKENVRHFLHLLKHMSIDKLSMIAMVITVFPPVLIRKVFMTINAAHFHHQLITRDDYLRSLARLDSRGLTPLHYAIKNRHPLAFHDLLSAMSTVFTAQEHIDHHMTCMPHNAYVDWIRFYDEKKLEYYRHYLTSHLQNNTAQEILYLQAQSQQEMRIRYDNDSQISQALISFGRRKEPAKNIHVTNRLFNFKLFRLPASAREEQKAGYENDPVMPPRQRQLSP